MIGVSARAGEDTVDARGPGTGLMGDADQWREDGPVSGLGSGHEETMSARDAERFRANAVPAIALFVTVSVAGACFMLFAL